MSFNIIFTSKGILTTYLFCNLYKLGCFFIVCMPLYRCLNTIKEYTQVLEVYFTLEFLTTFSLIYMNAISK